MQSVDYRRQDQGQFDKNHMILADGTALQADAVVLATGHDNMHLKAKKIFGAAVADRYKDVWDEVAEDEVNAVDSTYH